MGGCDDCAKSGGGRLTYDVIVLNFAIFRTNVCVLFVTIRSSAIQWISLLLKGIKGKRVILHFVWKVLSKNRVKIAVFGPNLEEKSNFRPIFFQNGQNFDLKSKLRVNWQAKSEIGSPDLSLGSKYDEFNYFLKNC